MQISSERRAAPGDSGGRGAGRRRRWRTPRVLPDVALATLVAMLAVAPALAADRLGWRRFDHATYRAALANGTIRPGLLPDETIRSARPTDESPPADATAVILVHGYRGSPAEMARLGAYFAGLGASTYTLSWDDQAPLRDGVRVLIEALATLPTETLVVAHSLGGTIVAYAGATATLPCVGVVYANPLIGGSHWADEIPVLEWLRFMRPYVVDWMFPPSVRDLEPDSSFQQAIFGRAARPPSFGGAPAVVFTEAPGDDPGIRPHRLAPMFGQTREELVRRLGETVTPASSARGHMLPVEAPETIGDVLQQGLARVQALRPACRSAARRASASGEDEPALDPRAAAFRGLPDGPPPQ